MRELPQTLLLWSLYQSSLMDIVVVVSLLYMGCSWVALCKMFLCIWFIMNVCLLNLLDVTIIVTLCGGVTLITKCHGKVLCYRTVYKNYFL